MKNLHLKVLICVAIAWALSDLVSTDGKTHEQVHISLGSLPHEMVVTWQTVNETIPDAGKAEVQYGTSKDFGTSAIAEVEYFKVDNLYTYRALMSPLKFDTTYYYRVGSPGSSWSEKFHFKTLKEGNKWLPKLIIFGDMGWQNQESLPYLEKERDNGFDVIYQIGDFAYDLQDSGGEKGNHFMRSISQLTNRVPFMALPGNHERNNNFTHYDARFSMLGDYLNPKPQNSLMSRINNHYHSEDIGPMHILSFSTEFYFFTQWGEDQIKYQYDWIVEDLKKAAANRAERPWIMVLGHRPLYCLRLGDKDSCNHEKAERPKIRTGTYLKNDKSNVVFGLEKLFYDHGVDIQIYGHEHFYSRFWPTYNHESHKDGDPYTDAKAPIYIITGSAGNRELHPAFNLNKVVKDIAPVRILDYGYGRLVFEDELHIRWEHTSIDNGNKVIDRIDIKKTQKEPFWLRK